MSPEPASPWLRDVPLDLETDEDAFGVQGLAVRLADLVARAEPPFTIALSGGWGVGKSTIARTIVSALRKRLVPAVFIDALTEDIPSLRRSLVVAVHAATKLPPTRERELELRKEVTEEIDRQLTTTASEHHMQIRGSWRRDHVAALVVPTLVIAIIMLALTVLTGMRAPDAVIALAASIYATLVSFLLYQSGLIFKPVSRSRGPVAERIIIERTFREAARRETGDRENGVQRIAVVVDNLDRLPGEDAIKALGEIRSLVEFEGSACVFIIPVDREALRRHITAALEGTPSTEQAGGESPGASAYRGQPSRAAHDFLDKFFNLDVRVTDPAPVDVRALAETLARAVLPRTADDEEEFRLAVQIVARAAGSSPRQVKKILNGVATRTNVIGNEGGASVAQIALIESALALVPGLAASLAEEPRRLSQVVEILRDDSDARIEPSHLGLAGAAHGDTAHSDIQRLVSLLVEFRDIPLDARTTRLILALGEDRRWRGVAEPERVEACLQSGDAAGFGTIMESLPPNEAGVVLERACDWIERSRIAFARDFANGLAAVVRHLDQRPILAAKVREQGWQVYGSTDGADDETVSRVTPNVAEFLFTNTTGGQRLRSAARRFASVLSQVVDSGRQPGPGLVRAAQLGAGYLDEPARAQLKQSLAKLTDDLLTPLFDPSIVGDLVDGPVLEAYASRASAIDLTAEDQAPATTALTRLAACARAGLEVPVDRVTARLVSELSATSGDLSDPALGVLSASVELFKAAPDTNQDQLALALAGRGGARRGEYFDLSLSMPISEAATAQVISYLRAWLQALDASPAGLELLLSRRIELIRSRVPDWPALLLTRWIGEDNVEFLRLVVEFGDNDERRSIGEYAAGSPSPPTRFHEAVEALDGDPSALGLVARAVATWVSRATPLARIGECAPTLVALADAGSDLGPISQAISARAEAIGRASELAQLIQAVRALAEGGLDVPPELNNRLLSRSVALGLDDAVSAAYFLDHLSGSEMASLAASAISNPATSVDAALSLARKRPRNGSIRAALVARAADPGTSEDDARRLLEAAQRSPQPPRNLRGDYEAFLTQVASRYPSLDGLVNRLRLGH